ncbi:flavin-dependent oxidoreductase [Arsenicibacter rosenii]|uniref:Flavin-dependent oxidoreductase n=1 Tax=Arsenicibacter rosenii TaxID=1750698 RepID=A0A1S2VLV4_9BACT|nr:flavin-dependent oxidoreductase [Arsenicibacter rosenii]OIN59751.1 flavin-dependent oxidoreductase [Arsenicibacter rosenii]
MHVLIVGGGIGGLTTALCLHQAGFSVQVFESAQQVKPLGVGINLLPHSVRVLTDLGLQGKLSRIAVETQDLRYFNKHGQLFWEEPRGRHAGYHWPQFSIHRGYFQQLLFDTVQETIGAGAVHTGHHLVSFEQHDTGVTATFINRTTGEVVCNATGHVLIGCDGIHSVVRKQLYPEESGPRFSGNVLYRGTTVMPPFLTSRTMAMIGHLKQKMVVYPIQAVDADGNQLVNWVANLREPDNQTTVRDWNRQADQQRLVDIYRNWQFDWLDVPAMIANAPAVFEFPMSDRDPLDRWSFGRVTLLGDAAHPMYPIGSNGASQAILDAEALTNALLTEADPLTALDRYDRERVPATTSVVLQNRQKGPDQIMDMMEEAAPDGFTNPDDAIPYAGLKAVMDNYRQVAGFDKETLNKKRTAGT